MRGFSKNFFIALIMLTVLVLLSDCETGTASKAVLYVNKEHRFTVTYPKSWKKLKKINPTVPFYVSAAAGLPCLGVYFVTGNFRNFENLPKETIEYWANSYPNSSEHKIVSVNMIILDCGTTAIEFIIEWCWGLGKGGEPLRIVTTTVVAERDNMLVFVYSTNIAGKTIDINKKVTRSLKFY